MSAELIGQMNSPISTHLKPIQGGFAPGHDHRSEADQGRNSQVARLCKMCKTEVGKVEDGLDHVQGGCSKENTHAKYAVSALQRLQQARTSGLQVRFKRPASPRLNVSGV